MSTVNLTAGTFEQTIRSNDIVLVDFWAAWCGPCRMFAPVYEKASGENADIVFGKVDTEAEQVLAAQADITSIPTLMVFRENVLVFSRPGALPASALEELITAVRARHGRHPGPDRRPTARELSGGHVTDRVTAGAVQRCSPQSL